MKALSATCVAIAIAIADRRGTLRLIERTSRFGDTFIALADDHGTIEIADDRAAAEARVAALRERAAA